MTPREEGERIAGHYNALRMYTKDCEDLASEIARVINDALERAAQWHDEMSAKEKREISHSGIGPVEKSRGTLVATVHETSAIAIRAMKDDAAQKSGEEKKTP